MSFFKDFKEDFTQAMNELMPDGNEMYDEDGIMEDALAESEAKALVKKTPVKEKEPAKEKTVTEKPAKEKKSVRGAKKEDREGVTEGAENRKVRMSRPPKEIPLKTRIVAKEPEEDELDIAPEDMSEQIDDLLNQELYGDEVQPAALLDDDTEVNTMDMSVEELLSQLSEKKQEEEKKTEAPEELSIDDLLSQLDSAPAQPEDVSPVTDGEPEQVSYTSSGDLGLEALLDSIAAKNNVEPVRRESQAEPALEVTEPETVIEDNEAAETVIEDDEAVETMEAEAMEDEVLKEGEAPEAVSEEIEEARDGMEEALEEAMEAISEEADEAEDTLEEEPGEEPEEQTKIEDAMEENEMSAEKDVISMNPAEKKPGAGTEETAYNSENADTETTYITKGSKLTGDLETDGSIDIIGTIEGSVSCKGKVVVGGKVVGNIVAGELYANNARIEGDIKSYGSIKVGVGSMIIGGMEGESAVIAGAVNGDIDVKGPVIVDSTAVIMGNIKSRSVQINNGAVIEGFCSQSYSDIDVKSFFA